MNYNYIFCFFEKGFFAGNIYISYCSFDEIISYREKQTSDGILIYCILKKDKKEVEFEKLLVDEYIYLKEKLKERNNFVIQ